MWLIGLLFCIVGGCLSSADFSDSKNPDISFPTSGERLLSPLTPPFSLAILPLEGFGPEGKLYWLSYTLPELLVSDLARWPSIDVVSRKALGSVLREQYLQQRGFSSTTTAVDLGHLQGVHYILQGVIHAQDEILTVDLQLIDVETGVIVGSMRSSGKESEIPQIERELVQQIIHRFESSQSIVQSSELSHSGEGPSSSSEVDKPFSNTNLEFPGNRMYTRHSLHRIDSQLSLERLTHERLEALSLAETVWTDGLKSELGHILMQSGERGDSVDQPMALLAVPISVSFDRHRLERVFEKRKGLEEELSVVFEPEHLRVFPVFSGVDGSPAIGANTLFFERFSQPRRLFVRALSGRGKVLAVYSDWSWSTTRVLTDESAQSISIPLFPKAFFKGVAKFPARWVSSHGEHVTFDFLIVPTSKNEIMLKIEPLLKTLNERSDDDQSGMEMSGWIQNLERNIQAYWTPPVSEGLPEGGYLPGNKRTGLLRLSLNQGKVSHVHIHTGVYDPLFELSLLRLKNDLMDFCVACVPEFKERFLDRLDGLSLQLILRKQIQALKLGSTLP